jgi:23S rRNA-/tRNA-specific pseudouridylate synthase
MLSALTRDGHIKKIYRAVVLGKTPPDGEISISLYKDERRNLVRPAGRDQPGMDALTRYRTILRSETYSLVELELVTGRPHQARVHMSSIGFPIKGDFKYGDRRSGDVTGAPLCLHAFSLIFPDAPGLPDEIRGLAVVSPMPPEFFSLAKLGNAT